MKPRSLMSLVSSLLVGMTLFASASASAEDTLETIMARKSIAIGIPADFPPYGFIGPDFKPQGLDVAVAQLVADKLGVKAELMPVSTPNRIPYLQVKKIDLIVSALGKTPEREQVIDFTIAYAPFFQAIYGPKALSIKSFDDLAGKSVSVTRSTIQDNTLTQMAPPSTKIMRFDDDAATVAAFVSGQAQMLCTGAAVAAAAVQKNPNLQAEYKLLLKDSPNFMGVRKGDKALLEKVNAIIRQAKADGTLEAYARKWLGRGTGNLPE
ncbi:MAG: amino acid transporter substrate-binding protein family [Proteobacteria bacterium]|nr:amino acid transporter substrate-binding protein family [Pseudomonadota bacterium]